MEIKINFNKLFDAADEDTPCTTSLENSYQQQQYQEPSLQSTPPAFQEVDHQYRLNANLFDDSIEQNNSNILHEISSLDHSVSGRTDRVYKKENSVIFNPSYDKGLTPGERLYHESKQSTLRKQKQMQKLQAELLEQEAKETTFKPIINPNSKKLIENAQSPSRKQPKRKKLKSPIKTFEEKQAEQAKSLTFRPTINSDKKRKKEHLANSRLDCTITYTREKGQVFNHLYNDHKLKEMRKQMKLEESTQKEKKMSKADLNKFFERNEEYLDRKQQKEQLMKKVSSQYDLSSGRKLFTPQTEAPIFKSTSSRLQGASSASRLIDSPSSGLFNKMHLVDREEENEPATCISLESMKRSQQQGGNQSSRRLQKQSIEIIESESSEEEVGGRLSFEDRAKLEEGQLQDEDHRHQDRVEQASNQVQNIKPEADDGQSRLSPVMEEQNQQPVEYRQKNQLEKQRAESALQEEPFTDQNLDGFDSSPLKGNFKQSSVDGVKADEGSVQDADKSSQVRTERDQQSAYHQGLQKTSEFGGNLQSAPNAVPPLQSQIEQVDYSSQGAALNSKPEKMAEEEQAVVAPTQNKGQSHNFEEQPDSQISPVRNLEASSSPEQEKEQSEETATISSFSMFKSRFKAERDREKEEKTSGEQTNAEIATQQQNSTVKAGNIEEKHQPQGSEETSPPKPINIASLLKSKRKKGTITNIRASPKS